MNAQQKYLAWLRITAPEVYTAALRTVARKPRGLGGLSDDLLTRMQRPCTGFGFLGDDSADLPTITVTADAPTADTSGLTLDPNAFDSADLATLQQQTTLPALPADVTAAAAAQSQPTGLFNSIVSAVAGVATTALNVSGQSNLVKVNTQRAAMGLPPVNAQGVPISNSFFRPSTNPQLAALEASVGGFASSPLVWVAGLGLIAFLLLGKRA
jgi:hypothetical protein